MSCISFAARSVRFTHLSLSPDNSPETYYLYRTAYRNISPYTEIFLLATIAALPANEKKPKNSAFLEIQDSRK